MGFGKELKDFVSAFKDVGGTISSMQLNKAKKEHYEAGTEKLKKGKADPVGDAFRDAREGVPVPDTSPRAPAAAPEEAPDKRGALPTDEDPVQAAALPGYDDAMPDEMKAPEGVDPSEHMAYLLGKSKDPKIAAALLGNAWQESGLNPTIMGDQDRGGSFGLYQFNAKGRKPAFDAWSQENQRDPNMADTQHDFVLWDLQNNFPKVWQAMQAAPTPEAASDVFMTGYERPDPAKANAANRRKKAIESFQMFQKPEAPAKAGALDLG